MKNFLFKSVPIESLLKAIENIKATFIILQRHPSSDELNNIHLHLPHIKMMDMSQLNEDLPRMVALLSILDDYIGVSNTNMHLNAALHKSSKVLLPHPPEWRWMLEGNISPWFPHNSIFRQQPQNRKDKSWNAAFNQLTEQLENQYGR